MKVILLQEVPNLGRPGEVKEVADGYGRNYLLPRQMAIAATSAEMKRLESLRATLAQREAKTRSVTEALGSRLEGLELTVKARVGAEGRLFGSITNVDIAEALAQELGQEIDRRLIQLEEPIKQAGRYQVPLRLTRDVMPTVTVIVEGETP